MVYDQIIFLGFLLTGLECVQTFMITNAALSEHYLTPANIVHMPTMDLLKHSHLHIATLVNSIFHI